MYPDAFSYLFLSNTNKKQILIFLWIGKIYLTLHVIVNIYI